MTKIRTSAYAVRCRVPSDHRHPGGARTYNDNSGQALFEHRIVDGLPIVKRQFSCETWGGATVVPHGRRSHRNSLRPLQPLGACARKRERGEGRGKEKKKKVKGKISWGKRERGEIGCRRDIYVTRWRGQRICIFDVSIISFFPSPFTFTYVQFVLFFRTSALRGFLGGYTLSPPAFFNILLPLLLLLLLPVLSPSPFRFL